MSRKTIMVFVAVIGAVLALMASTFGLSIDAAALTAGLGSVLIYVFGEGKADIQKISTQIGKFKDPKFLIAIVNAIIAGLGTGEVIPPALAESIIAFLTLLMGILFKKDPRIMEAALRKRLAERVNASGQRFI